MPQNTRLAGFIAITLFGLAASSGAQAQTTDPAPPSDAPPPAAIATGGDSLTIGGGLGFAPSYEGSDNYVLIPAAVVRGRVKGIDFFTLGTDLYVDVISADSGSGFNFQLGPVVSVNLNRSNRIADDQVRALGKRRVALELGGYAGVSKTGVITSDYDTLGARVSIVQDVTGIHDSYIITPQISYGTPLSRKAYVGLSASATIVGDGYARTYFAVDAPGSVRSGLPVFANPRGGFKDFTIGALGNYAVTGDLLHGFSVFAAGGYSRLQGDFARSPIVGVAGSPNQWFGGIGIGYTF